MAFLNMKHQGRRNAGHDVPVAPNRKIRAAVRPPEFFALAFSGLGAIITVSGRSIPKGLMTTFG
jgi:hypothetical protein